MSVRAPIYFLRRRNQRHQSVSLYIRFLLVKIYLHCNCILYISSKIFFCLDLLVFQSFLLMFDSYLVFCYRLMRPLSKVETSRDGSIFFTVHCIFAWFRLLVCFLLFLKSDNWTFILEQPVSFTDTFFGMLSLDIKIEVAIIAMSFENSS